MKRLLVITLLLIIGIISVACLREPPPQSLNITSPDGIYRVQLNENVDIHSYPYPLDYFEFRRFNEVRFNAFKGADQLASNNELWKDTSSNMRFLDVYKPQWINDSVLKFGLDKEFPVTKMDELTVINNSNQSINYLVIQSVERFVILDLQPGKKVKLSTYPQSGSSYVSCWGRFHNKENAFYNGVNFPIKNNFEKHVSHHYFITINEDEVLIQSREIEGYVGMLGDEKKIPKCSGNFLMSSISTV